MKRNVGHKDNSFLNGEWCKHVKRAWKKVTSGKRRSRDKKIIRTQLLEILN